MIRLLSALRVLPCATHRPHFIEPHVAWLREQLQAGRVAAVDARLSRMGEDMYEHLIWRACREREMPRWLAAWAAARPASRHPPLISAYMDICDAWAVRGETYVSAIPFLRRRRYPKIMAKACAKFQQIIDQHPGCPMALAGLIHCDVVVGIGEGQRAAWLNELLAAGHFHGPAIRQYARGTWPRWDGQDDQHIHFANWVLEHAPAGSSAHVVAADAVLDDAFTLSEELFTPRRVVGHLADQATAAWIRRAILRWADATPATLASRLAEIGRDHRDDYAFVCLEKFALAAYFAGANEEARMLLSVLGAQLQCDDWKNFVANLPMYLHVLSFPRRRALRVHDRVCRDLGLDPAALSTA